LHESGISLPLFCFKVVRWEEATVLTPFVSVGIIRFLRVNSVLRVSVVKFLGAKCTTEARRSRRTFFLTDPNGVKGSRPGKRF